MLSVLDQVDLRTRLQDHKKILQIMGSMVTLKNEKKWKMERQLLQIQNAVLHGDTVLCWWQQRMDRHFWHSIDLEQMQE